MIQDLSERKERFVEFGCLSPLAASSLAVWQETQEVQRKAAAQSPGGLPSNLHQFGVN